MDRLYVYADFNWLEKPVLVGELGFESIRGSLHIKRHLKMDGLIITIG